MIYNIIFNNYNDCSMVLCIQFFSTTPSTRMSASLYHCLQLILNLSLVKTEFYYVVAGFNRVKVKPTSHLKARLGGQTISTCPIG